MLDLNFQNSCLALSANEDVICLQSSNLCKRLWNLLSEDSGISARLMGFKDHAKQAKYEFGGPFSMI